MISTCLWGQTGPERAYPGFGGQGSALAGFNYLTGWPDREPLGPFGTITDSISPRFGAVAICAALLHRARTGAGRTSTSHRWRPASMAWRDGCSRTARVDASFGRVGNRSPHAAPHGVFPCAGDDRWIAIAVHDDADWQRLVQAMGAPAWATAAPLAHLDGRLRQLDAARAAPRGMDRAAGRRELAAQLQAAGLDAAAVEDMQDLLRDPQLAHRGHFVRSPTPCSARSPSSAAASASRRARARLDGSGAAARRAQRRRAARLRARRRRDRAARRGGRARVSIGSPAEAARRDVTGAARGIELAITQVLVARAAWLALIALAGSAACAGAGGEAAPPASPPPASPPAAAAPRFRDATHRSVFAVAARQKPRIVESLAAAGIEVTTNLLDAGFTLRVTVGAESGLGMIVGSRNSVSYSLRLGKARPCSSSARRAGRGPARPTSSMC